MLEVGQQGFGFLRDAEKNFRIQNSDVFVGKHVIKIVSTVFVWITYGYCLGAFLIHEATQDSLTLTAAADQTEGNAVARRVFAEN